MRKRRPRGRPARRPRPRARGRPGAARGRGRGSAAARSVAVGPASGAPARGASAASRLEAGRFRAGRPHQRHHRSGPGRQGLGGVAARHHRRQGRCAALRSGHRHGRCLWQGHGVGQRLDLLRPGSAPEGRGEPGHDGHAEVPLHGHRRFGQRATGGPARQRALGDDRCDLLGLPVLDEPGLVHQGQPLRLRHRSRRGRRAQRRAVLPGRADLREPVADVPAVGRAAQRPPAADVLAEFDQRLRTGAAVLLQHRAEPRPDAHAGDHLQARRVHAGRVSLPVADLLGRHHRRIPARRPGRAS